MLNRLVSFEDEGAISHLRQPHQAAALAQQQVDAQFFLQLARLLAHGGPAGSVSVVFAAYIHNALYYMHG